jgi:3-oxoacyl-[acyl-carrier protein] reductase
MQDSQQPLAGQVAIVTGAGRGIGRAIAQAYAQAGAAVCCAARTADEVNEVARAIVASGGRAFAATADVTDLAALKETVAATEARFGGVDIVVVNAGASGPAALVGEDDAAAWGATIAVNLTGAYNTVHAAVPALKRRGAGKIITIGSGLGRRGARTLSAYACSKAGLAMLTRVLAAELAEFNIEVNELIPGPVATAMMAGQGAQQQLKPLAAGGEWLKTVEDVVPLAMFLATQPKGGPTAQTFSLARREL